MNDKPVELTAIQFCLLQDLMKNPGCVRSREELLSSVWDYQFDGYDRTVDTHIKRLRDRQSGGLGNFIEIIELLFDQVRPEWKNISYQLIKESGRILHTHKEKSQSFKAIKHSKEDPEDTQTIEKSSNPEAEVLSPVEIYLYAVVEETEVETKVYGCGLLPAQVVKFQAINGSNGEQVVAVTV